MSKPAFDPNQPFEAQDQKPQFDPNQPFEPGQDMGKPAPIGPGEAESAIRGAAKGATFGFADEAAAGLMGAKDWAAGQLGMRGDIPLSDAYETNLNVIRQRDAQAREANPKSFLAGEIGGNLISPIGKVLAAPSASALAAGAKEVGTLGMLGRGVAAGALSGAGESNAYVMDDGGLARLGQDTLKGGALGGALAGGTRLVGSALGSLAPDALRETARKYYQKAIGVNRGTPEMGDAIALADEAGPAIGGFARTAEEIGEGAAQKAKFFAEQGSQPTWNAFGGAPKIIGGGMADLDKMAADRAKAQIFEEIAKNAGQRTEALGARQADLLPAAAGFMTTMMHSSNPLKAALVAGATGVASKVGRERGASMVGGGAQGLANVLESAPPVVGTAAGAARQYLNSGSGGQALTQEMLFKPEKQASQREGWMHNRERLLEETMKKRMEDLRSQGMGQR